MAPDVGPGSATRDWILTWTGRKVRPLHLEPGDVCPEDVAHALANTCRYRGMGRYYSVAEHSVRVARVVYARERDLGLARWALLHDAAEAYLGDVPAPVKHLPEFAAFREAEDRAMRAVCSRFLLPWPEPMTVKFLDKELRGTEVPALFPVVPREYGATLPDVIAGQHGLGWAPTHAEEVFMTSFGRLFPNEFPPGWRQATAVGVWP